MPRSLLFSFYKNKKFFRVTFFYDLLFQVEDEPEFDDEEEAEADDDEGEVDADGGEDETQSDDSEDKVCVQLSG